MSELRELRPVGVVRADLEDREALQESFQEIITDLNEITAQWNGALYPLLASLPQGREQRSIGDRNAKIDPITNGLDGSQVYMDQTSRPQEFGGLLHNGTRPRTIKEVVLDSYQSLFGRVGRVEDLLNEVNANNAAYDDTQLRNWIIQLAGETWDPDNIGAGGTFNTVHFAGAPVASTYSLAERILDVKHQIGTEAEINTFRDISTRLEISGSTYMVGSTDILTALGALDTAMLGLGGVATLQTAYNNGNTISTVAINPVQISVPVQSVDPAINIDGLLTWTGPVFAGTGDAGTLNFMSMWYENDEVSGTEYTQSLFATGGAAPATDLLELRMTRGSGQDETDELFIGKQTATADPRYGGIFIGRQTIANGGLPHVSLYSEDSVGAHSFLTAPHQLTISNTISGNLTIDAWASLLMVGAAGSSITTDDFLIDTTGGDFITLDAGTFARISSGSGVVDINAGNGMTVDLTLGSLVETISDPTALGIFTRTASGTGANSRIKTIGAANSILVDAQGSNSSALVKATNDAYLYGVDAAKIISGGGGIEFHATNAAWITGLTFNHGPSITSAEGAGTYTANVTIGGDGEIGSFKYLESLFADNTWQGPATADADGLVCTAAAFSPTGWAPHDDGVTYGGVGGPDPYRVYKDNVVKSKGMISVDPSKGTHNISAIDTSDLFNVDVTAGSTWTVGTGILKVVFETALGHANYTVTTGYDSTATYTLKVRNKLTTGFDIEPSIFNAVTPAFDIIDGADPIIVIDFQVI